MFTYRAVLNRIVDGDTIDVAIDLGFDIHYNTRVRLFGINTPECRTRDLEEKKRGLAAKARLGELLKGDDYLTIRTQLDKSGKYGRVLGEVFMKNVSINEVTNKTWNG